MSFFFGLNFIFLESGKIAEKCPAFFGCLIDKIFSIEYLGGIGHMELSCLLDIAGD